MSRAVEVVLAQVAASLRVAAAGAGLRRCSSRRCSSSEIRRGIAPSPSLAATPLALAASADIASPRTAGRHVVRGVALVTALVVAIGASAAVYVVDTTTDLPDANVLDPACDDGSGRCSLRAAIQQANENIGLDDIEFAIGGGGLQTIRPTSALPAIGDADGLFIDGTTQPGYAGTPLIELDGSLAGPVAGLRVTLGHSGIDGLNIHSFASHGILLQGSHWTYVRRCFIGTDPSGMMARPNGTYGLYILTSEENWIGRPGEGNLIAGNTLYDIHIRNLSNLNEIKGNLIGTDATGAAALGVRSRGVLVKDSVGNFIGGPAPGEGNVIAGAAIGVEIVGAVSTGNSIQGNTIGTDGVVALTNFTGVAIQDAIDSRIGDEAGNVISGNLQHGVQIRGALATGTVVAGNSIGVAADGVTPLGNAQHGVLIHDDASASVIGGPTVAEGNVIAYNGMAGVAIESGSGNRVQRNAIDANVDLGIDLGGDGVTVNDGGDGDTGPNGRQNFPEGLLVSAGCLSTDVSGTLSTTANTTVEIDIYAVRDCDPSGHGEGRDYLGSTSGTSDGSGQLGFLVTLPVVIDPATQTVTTTVTSAAGDTSEFSACVTPSDDCAGGCSVAAIGTIGALRATKASNRDDVELSWLADSSADDGYNVSYVILPRDIPACAGCLGAFPVGTCQPTGAIGNTTCTHFGAVSDPQSSTFFYEVRGVCGGQEAGQ